MELVKWTRNQDSKSCHGTFAIGEAGIVYDATMGEYAYTIRFNRSSYVSGSARTLANAKQRVEYNVRLW